MVSMEPKTKLGEAAGTRYNGQAEKVATTDKGESAAEAARRMAIHLATGLILAAALGLTGCPAKGPAEKAGESIDRATDKVSDAVNPKGPLEKAGRAIDRATD